MEPLGERNQNDTLLSQATAELKALRDTSKGLTVPRSVREIVQRAGTNADVEREISTYEALKSVVFEKEVQKLLVESLGRDGPEGALAPVAPPPIDGLPGVEGAREELERLVEALTEEMTDLGAKQLKLQDAEDRLQRAVGGLQDVLREDAADEARLSALAGEDAAQDLSDMPAADIEAASSSSSVEREAELSAMAAEEDELFRKLEAAVVAATEAERQAEALEQERSAVVESAKVQLPDSSGSANGSAGLQEQLESYRKTQGALEEMRAWYAAITTTLEALGGVSVRSVDHGEDGVSLAVDVLAGAEDGLDARDPPVATLLVQLDSKLRARDAQLTLGDGMRCGLDDLVDAARQMNAKDDLSFLVVEASRRARCMRVRHQHVRALQRNYLVSKVSGEATPSALLSPSETLLVTLSPGAVVKVAVSPDYPLTPASVQVSGMVGALNWRKDELAKVEARANSTRANDLIGLMAFVDRELRAADCMVDDPEHGLPMRNPSPGKQA